MVGIDAENTKKIKIIYRKIEENIFGQIFEISIAPQMHSKCEIEQPN